MFARVKERTMLKVGLAELPLNTRFAPTALLRACYLTAVATRMDSFWVPDHLNSLFPRR
jgi:phthiodiolone/phenolphthiodiolone dimycocerosates ketoreductase